MSRASRLLELLELLRKRRAPVPASELAAELAISVRTLYRDIVTLQERGADIRGEPGMGYVLRPGFTLPPLMFTADEIEALVLGSRWVEVRGDTRLSGAAASALAKVRGVLPTSLRPSIDEAILTVPGRAEDAPTSFDSATLRQAIRAEHKLRLTYRDTSGKVSKRVVWPFLIGYFERVQVLAAWCELRQDFRAFRLDRIQHAEATGLPYPRKRTALVRQWRQAQGIGATDGQTNDKS